MDDIEDIEDYFSDVDPNNDDEHIQKYKDGTKQELELRSRNAISVLQHEYAMVYINDIYMEDGRIAISFDTFPPVSKDKTNEIEQFILQQVDNAPRSSDLTWFNRIPSVFFNCYSALKKRLFS